MKIVLVDEIIAGSMTKFEMEGDTEITYWVDRNFWGKGIAKAALEKFIPLKTQRVLEMWLCKNR